MPKAKPGRRVEGTPSKRPSCKIPASNRKSPPRDEAAYRKARKSLIRFGVEESLIDYALNQLKPPYGLNEAMKLIEKRAEDKDVTFKPEKIDGGKFHPRIGLRICKTLEGSKYMGRVTSNGRIVDGERVRTWQVTYDHGHDEDMDVKELAKWHVSRPARPSVDQRLFSLEISSGGHGHFTRVLAERNSRVCHIDVDSLARNDSIKYEFDMVPDFIWASLCSCGASPVFTLIHPNVFLVESQHNHRGVLTRFGCIVKWAKWKNPHLIVLMEIPDELFNEDPVENLKRALNLATTQYTSCHCEQCKRPSTWLLTNDAGLMTDLKTIGDRAAEYPQHNVCTGHCPSIFPRFMAEETIAYVSKTVFTRQPIRTSRLTPSKQEQDDLNNVLITYKGHLSTYFN